MAYVYTTAASGSVWTQVYIVTPSDTVIGDGFGESVSIYKDSFVIGSSNTNGAGFVLIISFR